MYLLRSVKISTLTIQMLLIGLFLPNIDADADDRLIRVAQRDIVERGRTIEAVMERYQRVLKPMHEQFIETCKRYADVIIPQGGHNNAAINMLVKFIKQELKEKK